MTRERAGSWRAASRAAKEAVAVAPKTPDGSSGAGSQTAPPEPDRRNTDLAGASRIHTRPGRGIDLRGIDLYKAHGECHTSPVGARKPAIQGRLPLSSAWCSHRKYPENSLQVRELLVPAQRTVPLRWRGPALAAASGPSTTVQPTAFPSPALACRPALRSRCASHRPSSLLS